MFVKLFILSKIYFWMKFKFHKNMLFNWNKHWLKLECAVKIYFRSKTFRLSTNICFDLFCQFTIFCLELRLCVQLLFSTQKMFSVKKHAYCRSWRFCRFPLHFHNFAPLLVTLQKLFNATQAPVTVENVQRREEEPKN